VYALIPEGDNLYRGARGGEGRGVLIGHRYWRRKKMSSKLVNIPKLEVVRSDELGSWRRFLTRFDIALINVDFKVKIALDADGEITQEARDAADAQESRKKAAALLTAMGEEGMSIFETFDINTAHLTYEGVVEAFQGYFGARENLIILRHRFLTIKQKEGESITEFERRVRVAAAGCALQGLREAMIVQVVIMGMLDVKLRNELLVTMDLDLTRLTQICNRYDSADRTTVVLEGERRELDVVRGGGSSPRGERCFACGERGHFARDCKAQMKKPQVAAPSAKRGKCFSCGEEGHFARDCGRKDTGRKPVTCFKRGQEGQLYRGQPRAMGHSLIKVTLDDFLEYLAT
jgi:hypothetical protein